MLYIYTLCKALHVIYIHIMQGILFNILQGIIYMLYIFTYIHTIDRYFSCYMYSHIYILLKGISHEVANSNSSQKPLKHVLIFMHLLHSKSNIQIPRSKSCFWHFGLASTKLPTHSQRQPYVPNSFHKLSFTKSCANAIEEFHRTLGGCMFRHENQENGRNVACPIILEHDLGLRPSPSTPQFNKSKQQFKDKSLTFFSKYMQLRAPKYINGKLESPRMRYLLVGDE